jgi:thiosulfate/3-mercaptopyruvate sulfurtransferase
MRGAARSSAHLVDADWLGAHLDDARVVVCDVRWYLAGPRTGRQAYLEGHIPGARFVDLDTELAGPARPGRGGRHPLPEPEAFAAVLARLGVTEASLVVAYDDQGGAYAARLWWLLRYFGLEGGRVLDGGLGAWSAHGGGLTTEVPPTCLARPPLELRAAAGMVAERAEIERLVVARERGAPSEAVLLDARAPARFSGESEPVDARAGHVPGATNAPWADNLGADGRFLAPAALAARYRALGVDETRAVVCYCGSGVTACHDLLALTLAGADPSKLRLYPGSWSEWAAHASLPVATTSNAAQARRDSRS